MIKAYFIIKLKGGYSMVNIQNPTELYILKRLKELSEEDQLLAEEMVRSLGEWCRVEEVAI